MPTILDKEKFESLYKTYQPGLVNFAFFYLKNRQESIDLVQELFLSIWEKRDRFPDANNPRAYLMMAVKNRCYNQLSKSKIVYEDSDTLKEVFISTEDTSQPIESKEAEANIQSQINNLPEKCKEIFILSRFEHLSYREIASLLNISVKTVENQIGNALKQLRKNLKILIPLTISVLDRIQNLV